MMTLRIRLRGAKGETLVESLMAILLVTFASILFLSMVSAAARINQTAQEADEAAQKQTLITAMGPGAEGAVVTGGTVTVQGRSTEEESGAKTTGPWQLLDEEAVEIVRAQEDTGLVAYYLPQGGEAG